jgi:predicted acylesterase/phospholipase RssA
MAGTDTIGLVVQGGGMRGVYSMAALAALEEMGFGQCFDHVAGSSAGALNGAYFITGQASYGVETYIHYLSRKVFVNPFRLKKVVDIDYLVDHIGKKARPLHLHKLHSAHTTLHISLTESTHAQTRYVTNRTPGIDIWEAFRATAAIPLLYNKSVKVGDGHYVDGSISARRGRALCRWVHQRSITGSTGRGIRVPLCGDDFDDAALAPHHLDEHVASIAHLAGHPSLQPRAPAGVFRRRRGV